jgi:hypothetical protein
MKKIPVNKTGYLKGAKTAKNPVNIIPSSLITTQGMAFPIKANGKTLYPNTGQYKFPTSHVVETPAYDLGTNLLRLGKKVKPYLSNAKKAYDKFKGLFSSAEDAPKTVLKKLESKVLLPKTNNIVEKIETPVEAVTAPVKRTPRRITKGTSKGGTIQRQISAQGTIPRKAIESYASGKEVSEAERRVLKQALEQHNPAENNISFDEFLKNVESRISPLNQEIASKHSEYGLEGINRFRPSDVITQDKIHGFDESINAIKFEIEQLNKSNNVADYHKANDLMNRHLPYLENSKKAFIDKLKTSTKDIVDLNEGEGAGVSKNYTMLFSNPKQLGEGTGIADSGAKHFVLPHQKNSVLGHSRFFADDDDILHVLESQSDYFQGKRFKNYVQKRKNLEADLKKFNESEDIDPNEFPELATARNTLIGNTKKALDEDYNYEKEALGKYHIERLLQENMAHAHGKGYKKLRYPTSETGAKIQKYPFITLKDEFNTLTKKRQANIDNPGSGRYTADDGVSYYFNESAEDIDKRLAELEKLDLNTKVFSPERQTILKKYDEFPMMSKKVFGAEPKTVKDKTGQSWYEMDVPDEFDIRSFKKGSNNIELDKKDLGTNLLKLGKTVAGAYNKAKPYATKAYNKGFDFLYKNVPSIDKFLISDPLERAKKDLNLFNTSSANKKKIQAMRPNQNTLKNSNAEPMYWNTKEAEDRFQEIKKNEPNEYTENSLNEFLFNNFGVNRKGKNPGMHGTFSTPRYGSRNDLVFVDPQKNKTEIYDAAIHESAHSRSFRQRPTKEERKILDKAWEPLRERGTNNKIDEREAEAVQHELRMRLKDKTGSKVYTDKDVPKIKEVLSKFNKENHPYVIHPDKFDYKAITESLNKIGFAGMAGAFLNQNMQEKKNGSKLLKYKKGSKGVSLAFSRGEKDPKGGLTQKGVDKYNRATGGNLKMAVTTPPSKLKTGSKAANRRKSFCARMSGVKGPMRKPNGEPSRKALALRKWNC